MTSETDQEIENKETDTLDDFFEGQDEDAKDDSEEDLKTELPEEETEKTKGESEVEPDDKIDDKTEEPAPPAEEKEKLVPIAALHDERRKASQARKEVEDLKKLIPQTDEAPDPYDDIDAYNKWMRGQWETEQRTEQENLTKTRLEESRSRMLESESDYEKMEKIFGIMLADDPTLSDKMLASGDEAKFVYETAKKYREEVLGGKKPDPKPEEEADELDGANLATATAQDSNLPRVEKEETLDEMFDDQKY